MWIHGGHTTFPSNEKIDFVFHNFLYYDFVKRLWNTFDVELSITEHSACVYKNQVFIFGGTDENRSNKLYILDFSRKKLIHKKTSGLIPSPRSAHVAVVHHDLM